MFDYNNVIKNFPGTPRKTQENVIKNICDIFNDNKKFAVACVPTGVGKSHIAATFCRSTNNINNDYESLLLNGDAFRKTHKGDFLHKETIDQYNPYGGVVLTTTKSLQDQYNDLFQDSELLKGKNNYQCTVDANCTTDLAPCVLSPKLKESCIRENVCPYFNRRAKALISKFSVLNYNLFLTLPDFLRKRQVIVCDEATEIEDIIVSKYSLDISYAFLQSEDISYKTLTNDSSAFRWLNDLSVTVTSIINKLLENLNVKNNILSGNSLKDAKRLSKLISFEESLNTVITNWSLSEYIIERSINNITFTPYNINNLTKDIFDHADKIILMSAFIPRKIIDILGINPADYTYFEIDSPFDSKKSPIYCTNKYALSYKTMDKFLPKVIDQAIHICDNFKNDKGIIHTHTMQITEAFQKKTKSNSRFLYREHGKTNEDIIYTHNNILKDEPTVVVSPSLMFGVSFDDHAGRFQIILKAPYLPLSSKRIKLIFEHNPEYYQIKMLINLIQMCGRCTRNKDDYSTTFILDANICKALHKEASKLPKYFINRFI